MIERYPEFQKQMGLKNWVCIIGSNQTSDMKNADVFNCSLCHAPSCCYHVSRVILSLAETAGENSHTKDWVIATEYFLFCEMRKAKQHELCSCAFEGSPFCSLDTHAVNEKPMTALDHNKDSLSTLLLKAITSQLCFCW